MLGLKTLPEWVLRRFFRFLLERYARDVFETDIDLQQLKLELKTGSARLENVSINPRFIDQQAVRICATLSSQLKLSYSKVERVFIGSIRIGVLPPTLDLENIFVTLQPKDASDLDSAKEAASMQAQDEEFESHHQVPCVATTEEASTQSYLDRNIEQLSSTLYLWLLQQLCITCRTLHVEIANRDSSKMICSFKDIFVSCPEQFALATDVNRLIELSGLQVSMISGIGGVQPCLKFDKPLSGKVEIKWKFGVSLSIDFLLGSIDIVGLVPEGITTAKTLLCACLVDRISQSECVTRSSSTESSCHTSLRNATIQTKIFDALSLPDGESELEKYEPEMEEVFEDAVSDMAQSWISAESICNQDGESSFKVSITAKCANFRLALLQSRGEGLIADVEKIEAAHAAFLGSSEASSTCLMQKVEISELTSIEEYSDLAFAAGTACDINGNLSCLSDPCEAFAHGAFEETLRLLREGLHGCGNSKFMRRSLLVCRKGDIARSAIALYRSTKTEKLSVIVYKPICCVHLKSAQKSIEFLSSILTHINEDPAVLTTPRDQKVDLKENSVGLYIPQAILCISTMEDMKLMSLKLTLNSCSETIAATDRVLSRPENDILWSCEFSTVPPTVEVSNSELMARLHSVIGEFQEDIVGAAPGEHSTTRSAFKGRQIEIEYQDQNSKSFSSLTITNRFEELTIFVSPEMARYVQSFALACNQRKQDVSTAKLLDINIRFCTFVSNFGIQAYDVASIIIGDAKSRELKIKLILSRGSSIEDVIQISANHFALSSRSFQVNAAGEVEREKALAFSTIIKSSKDYAMIGRFCRLKNGSRVYDLNISTVSLIGDVNDAKTFLDSMKNYSPVLSGSPGSKGKSVAGKIVLKDILFLQDQKAFGHGFALAIDVMQVKQEGANYGIEVKKSELFLANKVGPMQYNNRGRLRANEWLEQNLFQLLACQDFFSGNFASEENAAAFESNIINVYVNQSSFSQLQSMLPPETRSPIGVFNVVDSQLSEFSEALLSEALSKHMMLSEEVDKSSTASKVAGCSHRVISDNNAFWYGEGLKSLEWDFVPELNTAAFQSLATKLSLSVGNITVLLEETMHCPEPIYCKMEARLSGIEFLRDSSNGIVFSLGRCRISDNLSRSVKSLEPSDWLIWPDNLFLRNEAAKLRIINESEKLIKLFVAISPGTVNMNNDRIFFMNEFFRSTKNAAPWEMLQESDSSDKKRLFQLAVAGSSIRLNYDVPRVKASIRASFWLSEQKGIVAGELPYLANTLLRNWYKEIIKHQLDRIRLPGSDYYKEALQALTIVRKHTASMGWIDAMNSILDTKLRRG